MWAKEQLLKLGILEMKGQAILASPVACNAISALFAGIASIACVAGDHLIEHPFDFVPTMWWKALWDTGIHAGVGGATWLAVVVSGSDDLWSLSKQFIGAFFTAGIIDLDHFIAARSVCLKDATSLSSRPFAHNSLALLLVAGVLSLISVRAKESRCRNAFKTYLFFLVTWGSHHLRDATRRGFWIGLDDATSSTAPVPYWWYVALEGILPLLFRKLYHNEPCTNYKRLQHENVFKDFWPRLSSCQQWIITFVIPRSMYLHVRCRY